MSDARARIHAMFRLTPDDERELDARLDAYRDELLGHTQSTDTTVLVIPTHATGSGEGS